MMVFRNNRRFDNICLKLNYSSIETINSIKYLDFILKNDKNMFDPSYNLNDIKIRTNVICKYFKMVDTEGKAKYLIHFIWFYIAKNCGI